jgi:hypothetical protein
VKIDEMGERLETAGKIIVEKISLEFVLQLTEITLRRIGIKVEKFLGEPAVGGNGGYTDAVSVKKKKQGQQHQESAI